MYTIEVTPRQLDMIIESLDIVQDNTKDQEFVEFELLIRELEDVKPHE